MCIGNLAIIILQQIRTIAMQNAGLSTGERGGVQAAWDAFTSRFNTINFNVFVIQKRVKQPHGI